MAAENNFICRKNFTNIFINFGNICRFCLSKTQNNVSIHETYLLEDTEGDSIFNFMLNLNIVKMNSSEKFPTLICKNCHEVVKMFYNFILLWKQSEKQLDKSYVEAIKETKEKSLLTGSLQHISKPKRRLSQLDEFNCGGNKINTHKNILSIFKPSQRDINEAYDSFKVMEAHFCFYCIPHKEFETGNDLFAHLKSHEKEDCYNVEYDDKFIFKSLNQHLVEINNSVNDVSWEDFKFLTEEDLGFDREVIDLC